MVRCGHFYLLQRKKPFYLSSWNNPKHNHLLRGTLSPWFSSWVFLLPLIGLILCKMKCLGSKTLIFSILWNVYLGFRLYLKALLVFLLCLLYFGYIGFILNSQTNNKLFMSQGLNHNRFFFLECFYYATTYSSIVFFLFFFLNHNCLFTKHLGFLHALLRYCFFLFIEITVELQS